MEYTQEKCKRKRKKHSNLFDDLFHICSQTSVSSNSGVVRIHSSKSLRLKESYHNQRKRNYLTRLFERKKLKDKSLSKKMKTPYDRKLHKTCWPIKLAKVTNIKTKPQEKKKKKPTQRSLMRKKFTNPTLSLKTRNIRDKSSSFSFTESDFEDEYFRKRRNCCKKKHFVFEPVSLRMLLDVLQDPEHLKSGATLDMIIAKLRALKLELKHALDLLREEVIQKLDFGIKLGLITHNDGYYKVPDNSRLKELSRTILIFGNRCKN